MQITKTFQVGDPSPKTGSSPCKVFKFADFQESPCAPARTRSLTDIIDRWNQDPARREGLKRARVELGRLTGGANEVTIRSMRLKAGMSQTDLARSIGTSQSHIARIEGKTLEPTLDTCRRLARALGVDLNTIDQALSCRDGAA